MNRLSLKDKKHIILFLRLCYHRRYAIRKKKEMKMETLNFVVRYDKEKSLSLAVIPTGRSLSGLPEVDDEKQKIIFKLRGNETSFKQTPWQKLSTIVTERIENGNYNIAVPNGKIDRMFRKGYGDAFSHTAQERAKMLYEAISTTDESGAYIFNAIYATGGSNTEDVIVELEKMLTEKGTELPKRMSSLKIFGFSDATQLFHYLGQRGVAQPMVFSNNILNYIDSFNKLIQTKEIDINVQGSEKDNAIEDGITIPGYLRQSLYRKSHSPKLSKTKTNLIFEELSNEASIDRLIEALASSLLDGKKAALILSKDTPIGIVHKIKVQIKEENLPIPIFIGAPFGHKTQMTYGKVIPLYADAVLEKNGKNFILKIKNVPDIEEVKDLDWTSIKTPRKLADHKITHTITPFFDGTSIAGIEEINVSPKEGVINVNLKHAKDAQEAGQLLHMGLLRIVEEEPDQVKTIKTITLEGYTPPTGKDKEIFDFWKKNVRDIYLQNANFEQPQRQKATGKIFKKTFDSR